MREKISKSILCTLAIVGLTVMPNQVRASEPTNSTAALEAMAKAADSPKEHAQVAKQYRLRAEALEAKAVKHEENANQMRKNTNAMAHKWPAMVNNGWQKESQLAVQARRAAQECNAIAAKHVGLAVEGQHSVD